MSNLVNNPVITTNKELTSNIIFKSQQISVLHRYTSPICANTAETHSGASQRAATQQ